jgi:hypothetical protein
MGNYEKLLGILRYLLHKTCDLFLIRNSEAIDQLQNFSPWLFSVEHFLSLNTKIIQSVTCPSEDGTWYQDLIEISFPWYAELDLPFYLPTGWFLQVCGRLFVDGCNVSLIWFDLMDYKLVMDLPYLLSIWSLWILATYGLFRKSYEAYLFILLRSL